MEISMYYTFSTIAQVLAAFIALSGVFLIFKIQELKKMQFLQVQNFNNVIDRIPSLPAISYYSCKAIALPLMTLHQSESLGGMLEEMDLILNDGRVKDGSVFSDLKRMHNIFQRIDRRRKAILRLSKISMISGIITIFLSVTVLTMVTKINVHLSILLFVFGLLGTFTSILLMITTIFKSLQEINIIEFTPDIKVKSRVLENPPS